MIKRIIFTLSLSALLIAMLLCMASCFSDDTQASSSSSTQNSTNEDKENPIVGVEGLEYQLSKDGTTYAVSMGKFNAKELTLPTTYQGKPVKYVLWSGFYNSTVEKVIVPDGYLEIYSRAFTGCTSLKSVELPSTLLGIEADTFNGCSALTKITIPSSVAYIYNNAFLNCSSLKEIVIPKSVTEITAKAFVGCAKLEKVYYGGTAEEFEQISCAADAWGDSPSHTVYYYSETEPETEGSFWHYVNDVPTAW